MQLTIEVRSDLAKGHKTWLSPGQRVVVGRTEFADVVLPEDGMMSARHFELQCDWSACTVRDCDSSNGTFVNGTRVTTAVLRDGDEITAGQTTFAVGITGGPVAGRSEPAGAALEQTVAAEVTEDAHAGLRFIAEPLDSGLTLYYHPRSGAKPLEVIRRLRRSIPLYLIVDLANLQRPVPADLASPQYVFEGFPPDIAPERSPLVLSPDDTEEFFALLEHGWGKEALVSLCSYRPRHEILDHLRTVARGYCSPRVWAAVLTYGTHDDAAMVLSGIEAVVLEGDEPDSWDVYAAGEFETTLLELGFTRIARTDWESS